MIHFIYSIISFLALPLYLCVIIFRVFIGKENKQSFANRFAIPLGSGVLSKYKQVSVSSSNDHKIAKKLIWLHAASVGESMVAMTVVEALSKDNKNKNGSTEQGTSNKQENLEFLITTGTISSANMVHKWASDLEDDNIYHQFVPIDNSLVAYIFCNYWEPSIALFIESEIWPNLVHQASKKCPSLIINARLSDKSFKRWSRNQATFQSIMSDYSRVIAQDEASKHKFIQLGIDDTLNLGNLKFSNKELAVDEGILQNLQQKFFSRKIFVAASTHAEDEEEVFSSIKRLYNKGASFSPIIVLRHPERKEEIVELCKYHNFKYRIRSEENDSNSNDKIADNELYIVDSFGELGLFYKIADIVFVGGSFKRGGHNLLEPAYFDCAIIVGPDMSHHQEIADDMIKQGAARRIQNDKDLSVAIEDLIGESSISEESRIKLSENALAYVMDRKKVVQDYVEEINKLL